MSEATPEAEAAQPAAEQQNDQPEAEATDWKAEARKWEARAKENSGAAKAAEKARMDAMTESERAIEEAKQSARAEATTEYGKELAQTQFDALAGRRNADFDTTKVLRRLDLSTLLDENGRPDKKAIQEAVADLVPVPTDGTATFDGGARSTSKTPDFNQVLRQAAGRA